MDNIEERERQRVNTERSNMCSDRRTFENAEGRRVWLWFPQLGGYGGHAEIWLYAPSAIEPRIEQSCFEIALYHDGEWPKDYVCYSWHACSPLQWMRFGLNVFEKQVAYFVDVVDKDARLTDSQVAELKSYRDRIDELLTKHAPPTEFTP